MWGGKSICTCMIEDNTGSCTCYPTAAANMRGVWWCGCCMTIIHVSYQSCEYVTDINFKIKKKSNYKIWKDFL